ncbi:unnamed protein product [Gulo gulo]|uniref:Uncharacterized protein n=1 Tax=Gulo gulo TaxID=48420 RepID=A0A9X9Q6P7_GULGU|nr:unnamed protein product [Gulo gulo]
MLRVGTVYAGEQSRAVYTEKHGPITLPQTPLRLGLPPVQASGPGHSPAWAPCVVRALLPSLNPTFSQAPATEQQWVHLSPASLSKFSPARTLPRSSLTSKRPLLTSLAGALLCLPAPGSG